MKFFDKIWGENEKSAKDQANAIQDKEDVRWLMSTPSGRRVVWKILSRCGIFKTSFSESAAQMAFFEGARNEGLQLLNDINDACPDMYIKMIHEQQDLKARLTYE